MKKKLKRKYKKALRKYRKQKSSETSGMYWHYEDPSDGQWFIGYVEDGHPCLV